MSYKNSVEWIKVIRRISSEEFRVFPRTVKSDSVIFPVNGIFPIREF